MRTFIIKSGKAMVKTFGSIADALPSKDTDPVVLTTEQVTNNDASNETAQAGTFMQTLYFFVGVIGFILILAALLIWALKFKKKTRRVYRRSVKRSVSPRRYYRRYTKRR